MKVRHVRLLPVLAIALAAPAVAAAPAPGAPIDDLRAEAEELNAELEANGAEIARLGEELDAAQARLDRARAIVADSEERIDAAEARIRELKALIAERAAAVYRTAGTDVPLDIINTENANDAGARAKYTDTARARDDALVAELRTAKEDLEQEKAEAERARTQAQRERDEIAATKAAADAAAEEQQALLGQVEGEIEEMLRQITREQAAAAPPAPAADDGDDGDGDGGDGDSADAPAPGGGPPPLGHGGAGAAVSYASAQVGKPYCSTNPERFGPNCYDCSGLTHSAWKAGGLTIPTVSGAQGSAYPRVPLDQLQPGDLITTSSWGAHVGIWVGGGYVHATKPGDVAKFVGGSGSVVDAVRPG